MDYKDLLVTTMEPMNKALGGLDITVLNFNSGQTYSRPNIVEIEIFCELTEEEKFVFSEALAVTIVFARRKAKLDEIFKRI